MARQITVMIAHVTYRRLMKNGYSRKEEGLLLFGEILINAEQERLSLSDVSDLDILQYKFFTLALRD